MPELPEVETTVRGLRERVVGKTIIDFWCDAPGMVRYISPTQMRRLVVGKKIIGARRRAKNVLIDLAGGKSLVIHMKMTGHILYGEYVMTKFARSNLKTWKAKEGGPLRDDPYNRFIHVVFGLSNGKHIAFCDMRKFGKIALHDTENLHTSKELANLGPELWEISEKVFAEGVGGRPGKIKQVLMDQKVLAGVGNIYSDEGLWAAGIHPLSKANKLTAKKLTSLFRELVRITKLSLKTGGDSMSDYRNVEGIGGKFQNFHKAYRQTGKTCQRPGCRGKIARIVVGSRGTHYCAQHQKLYGR
jgi:formamidopyrimidine-DNA glycosylase